MIMSSIDEIEAAIEKLDDAELAKLSAWWERHLTRVARSNIDAIAKTSGCLDNADNTDGEDFAKAVAEAGNDVSDSHGW